MAMTHSYRNEGDFIVLTIEGEIDLENAGQARRLFLDHVARGKGLVIDMNGVNLIDSSGVASLLEAYQAARKKGKGFILACVSEPVRRVFNLARLDKIFITTASTSEAIAKMT